MQKKTFLLLGLIIFFLGCESPDVVRYFGYSDHNVLNIGSQLTDLYITNDSNTLIAADKGNNQVLFIDVSSDVMSIQDTVWVGSEPTSLDMTDDGRYLFVGLRGGSSVSVINMTTLTFEGSINLEEDSVFDIEYLSDKCQLIVTFLAASPTNSKTYFHIWWADQDGIWYGPNTSCSYSLDPVYVAPDIILSESNEFTVAPPHIDDINQAGLLSVSPDDSYLYILSALAPQKLYGYEINDNGASSWILSSSVAANTGFNFFNDFKYVNDFGVVVAVDGLDPVNGLELDHAAVYDINQLDHISNLDVGSIPLAIAYDAIGEHIYISPTDVDDNGMFIVEFSIDTQLQTNYYQAAGLLGAHTLIVDHKGEYIYAAVDDISDQDTHEPYSGSSFNIQKIKIIPEGTYPINDF